MRKDSLHQTQKKEEVSMRDPGGQEGCRQWSYLLRFCCCCCVSTFCIYRRVAAALRSLCICYCEVYFIPHTRPRRPTERPKNYCTYICDSHPAVPTWYLISLPSAPSINRSFWRNNKLFISTHRCCVRASYDSAAVHRLSTLSTWYCTRI